MKRDSLQIICRVIGNTRRKSSIVLCRTFGNGICQRTQNTSVVSGSSATLSLSERHRCSRFCSSSRTASHTAQELVAPRGQHYAFEGRRGKIDRGGFKLVLDEYETRR